MPSSPPTTHHPPPTGRKVVLVTGGSRGIGAATARLAAERGFVVVVNYVSNSAAAEQVVAEIAASGGTAVAMQADVASAADVSRMFAEIDRRVGRLDALVNNAGIVAPAARVEDIDAARIERMFAVNVTGAFLCAREAIRRMSTARGGSGGAIVNVSSKASRYGSPNEYVDYAASKAALETFTVGLAKEVAAEGIRVNAVLPGVTATEIHTTIGDPTRLERFARIIPMKRIGEPREIARAILWLLSDEASYATGTLMDVTGGL
jgi:NAD(P)-dependent dehydrogenase (short-subunit alcohol dehydrogenase family)